MFFHPAIRTPIWEARKRSLEQRRHEEDPLYQVATYLASLDQLFDEQASILREQTHRAKKAELAVRMHQIRVAQTFKILDSVIINHILLLDYDKKIILWKLFFQNKPLHKITFTAN